MKLSNRKVGFFARLRRFRIPVILLLLAVVVVCVAFGWFSFLV